MSIYKELSYENYIEQVKGIRFCILSPNEIKRMSVAEITKTDTYIGTDPVINGLFDPRMGVLDHNKLCHTCEQKNTFCPGHFGHIHLAKPVFYIQFFDVVRKILKCVCWRCSKLLVDPESPQVKAILSKKYSRQKKWEMMYKLCSKVKRCGQETLDGCKAKQPDKIYREPIVKIVMEWKDLDTDKEELKKQVMNAEEVLRILQRITDDDAEALGFHRKYNRPEWMICTVLPVPPPAVRPSVRTDTGLRSEDDLTHKLCDIVKNNNTLRAKIDKGASKEQVDIATQVLQYHVATFIDNNIPGINPAQQRTGRLLKSLTERLKSKEGRIRGNLMGKRVDFSARSVITPDPNISIDELGVPIKIAMNLTFPEVVNKYNREKLMKLVKNGPDVYPGAKCLRQGGRTFLLKNKDRNTIELNDGDVVERHMMNGDYVLFNRQPSLHRMSMMGHRVVVMPYNTFRSNPSVCPCFNSDYDGDEMNAHLPQSVVTMNELVELAAVPTQIISPRECKPIIAIVQDVPLGVYRLTKSNVHMGHKQFMNLMSLNPRYLGYVPSPAKTIGGVDKWTGRQILSTIIPKNINLKAGNKSFDGPGDNENYVVIENGEIKQGIVDKLIYQNRTRGLIHSIFNECGQDDTRMFFDNTQRIICDWLVNNGFSVGISDLIVDQDTQDNLKKTIHDMKVKVYDIISQVHMGNLDNRSISNNNDYFESQVNKILNQASSQAGNQGLSKINDMTNRMINMIRSGSKGNVINVAQMIACLGQVNVEGKRIAYGFENRTLPHYAKYDDGPESRGFVESSFIKGLNPQEFFFHSMGGREGLIDTAVKSVTKETEILIIENKKPKVVEIGLWIDEHMVRCKDRIQYKEEKHTEVLELDTEVYIPNMDSKGNMLWSPMKYITRHDPDNELYEVETEGGRRVTVTQYDSMLIWNRESQEFLKKPTTEIKIGEFAPVTSKYPQPPIITEIVEVADYLPKTEYLYGTEFWKATNMMDEAMHGKFHIPKGWWAENNGKHFVLPYDKKARLQRVLVRSDLDAIKTGCVYNYAAQRGRCSIPETFLLDKEFGTFIGLYLAEGNCHIKSGKVSIANIDPNVKSFVKSWFDKYNIKHCEETREINLKNAEKEIVSTGTTCSVEGNSTLLAKFLDRFVGHGADNKFVPKEAYTAPEEFVIGLLNGYFAGDGTVGKNNISSSSSSQKLTQGISLLCSRLGAFGKISVKRTNVNNLGTKNILPAYTLDIRSRFAERLRGKLNLIIDYKNEALRNLKCSANHRNFPEENDVVMDAIKSITPIDITKHPKVYDVTVPGTYNFTLHNALCLRDTSETGYLQRKLVKAMEDCKISYDHTVRNASGAIVQFLYGEDGMDPTKIESQSLPYVEMDYAQLRDKYLITQADVDNELGVTLLDTTLETFQTSKDWPEKMKEHFDIILADRDFIIRDLHKGKLESSIMYPVSFQRILTNAHCMFKNAGQTDLNPMYVLIELNKLCDNIYITKWNKGNRFFQILARAYLSPKKVILEYKFDRNTFDYVIQQIKHRFYDAIAHPSEMVGVISAQSIGEPCTQMTLNSVEWNTELLLDIDGNLSRVKIGEFIDNTLSSNSINVENHPQNTKLGWIQEKNIKVLSCDEDGKIDWKLVEAVTRHPPINEDGSNTLVKVVTKSGREVIATKAKSFLTRKDNKIVPTRGDELNVGDFLPISDVLPIDNDMTSWDISKYLSKSEYVYMSEVDKAMKVYQQAQSEGNRLWFKNKNGKVFTVPYTRSDGFLAAYMGVGKEKGKGKRCNIIESLPNCVYPKNTIYQPAHIPENLQLDSYTGFFIGAYMAEGCCTIHHVLIANVDDKFNSYIDKFCERFSLKYHIDEKKNEKGHSKTLRIHSKVLAQLLTRAIGRTSGEKRFAPELLGANEEFLKGVINGYMSGDGSVDKKLNTLSATSISRGLVEDVRQILTKFGIQSTISPCEAALRNALNKGFDAHLAYKLQLNASNSYKFKNMFSLCIDQKQQRLDSRGPACNIDFVDIIPNISTKQFGVINVARNLLNDYSNKCIYQEDKEVFENVMKENVLYDEIVEISDFDSTNHPYVYDLTVKDTRNFNIYNGLAIRDTFHLSGVSSASKAVRGVPRMKELLSVTKNIKAPALTIHLDRSIRKDKNESKKVLNTIQTTLFRDIVKSSKIYFDPDDFNTTIEEDRLFLATYKEFIHEELMQTSQLTPWLLRFEFDKEKMKEHDITMLDLGAVLNDFYRDTVSCMFSDDTSNNLVMRVKLPEMNDDEKDIVTELKALEKNIMDNIIINGVKGINKVVMNNKEYKEYNAETMTFDKTNEWVLETNGTNLVDILGHKHVDSKTTISNDVTEIYEILGIEAARQALYNEISDIIKDADLYVNYRHIALLVDTMTTKGYLLSVDRHGINRVDIGPLAKCSFEEVTDMLVKAGIFSEVDKISGVSANIMLGQIPPYGTGDTDVLIDDRKLQELAPITEEEPELYQDAYITSIDPGVLDTMCDLDNIGINFQLPAKDSTIEKLNVPITIS